MNIDNIPDTNYQILLNLCDMRVPLDDGSYVTPDVLVILYANENIISELFEEKKRLPLKDRILPVYVRRNLSFSGEELIYKTADIPFKHVSPNALTAAAKFAVCTRIRSSTANELERLLDVYERFETLKNVNTEELEMIISRTIAQKLPVDGWTKGVSARKFLGTIFKMFNSAHSTCLTLEHLLDCINEFKKDYSAPFILVENIVKKIAFRDVTLAHILAIHGGGVETVENIFSEYYELLRDKRLGKRDKIEVVGVGLVPVENMMAKLAQKLNILTDSAIDAFNTAIDKYIDEFDTPPTFINIVMQYPEIISTSSNLLRYVPWHDYVRGNELSPQAQSRINKMLSSLEKLGYCNVCGGAVLRIAAREYIKI